MGQTFSVRIVNQSRFDVEVTIQGESHMVSSGREIAIMLKEGSGSVWNGTYKGVDGNGKIRVYQQGTVVREMTFAYDMNPTRQKWTLKDDGLYQPGMLSNDYYKWTYVKQ